MSNATWPTVLAVLALGCRGVGAAREPVVYGTDDRLEVYETPAGVHRDIAASAIAMQMDVGWLDQTNPDDVRVTYDQTLGEAHDLCADVRYRDQIEPGTCSGTLLDQSHLITAGHCVAAVEDCDGVTYPWIFGFYYESAGALRTLRADDVYYCVDTVVWRNDDLADYAVLELDRPVVGHTPVSARRAAGQVPVGTAITMIGHPNGIPMKVTGGATVLEVSGIDLHAEIDAFFGNSGSGVFDPSGELVGMLVAGSPADYQRRPGAGCSEIVVLGPGEDYEILVDVGAAVEAFCDTGTPSPVCDGAPDAGAPATDGGPSAADAGPGALPDAGTRDAGARDGGPEEGSDGCGCRVHRGGSHGAPLLAALVGLLALRRRRKMSQLGRAGTRSSGAPTERGRPGPRPG